MNEIHIHHGAVWLAAFSAFILGGIWYSPLLFANAWMRANGFDNEIHKRGNPAIIFGLAFIFSLGIAYTLAFFLQGDHIGVVVAIQMSVISGFGLAIMSMGIIALFERRPPAYFLINGGYLLLLFTIMGLILGWLR